MLCYYQVKVKVSLLLLSLHLSFFYIVKAIYANFVMKCKMRIILTNKQSSLKWKLKVSITQMCNYFIGMVHKNFSRILLSLFYIFYCFLADMPTFDVTIKKSHVDQKSRGIVRKFQLNWFLRVISYRQNIIMFIVHAVHTPQLKTIYSN